VGLRLPSDFDVNYLKRGNVLCDPDHPIKLVHTFIARLVIYDLGTKGAVCKGEPVMIHSYSAKGPGKLQQLISAIDQTTGEVIKTRPKFLRKGMFVNVQIKLAERQCLELFSNMKNMGRIVVRQDFHTIAAGTILEFVA
jgi:elongation factor 1 alpha-like protein